MFERVLIGTTALNFVQLPPDVDGIPALIAGFPGSLAAFDSEEGALGYEYDAEQQTLTLSYISGGERVAFVLDPWCEETCMLLTHARCAGYLLVALEGDEGTCTHACAANFIWDEMLALVGELRRGERRPLECFLPEAMLAVIDHAHYPHRAIVAEGEIGARSMNVVLTPSHLHAMHAD